MTLVLTTVVSALLSASSVQECVEASGLGQEARHRGALLDARGRFQICSTEACPELVRIDCAHWLDEVLREVPSVNVVVRVDGVDQSSAQVALDGAPWFDHLGGLPRELDPGEHEVSATVGPLMQTQKLVVVQGERNRLVTFELATLKVDAKPGAVSLPAGAMVFSALAVASGLSFAAFGLSGRVRLDALTGSPCAPEKRCNPMEVATVRREFAIADASLGLGIVSALVAVGWWWWSAHAP
jgi:hypothetical protein